MKWSARVMSFVACTWLAVGAVACALRGNGSLQPALTGRTPRQEISTDNDLSI